MSNIFKSNNRFAVLNENFSENTAKNKKRNEIENSKYDNNNNNNNNKNNYNNNNNNNNKNNYNNIKNNKNELKEKSKIIKEPIFSIESFPMLPPKENILESKILNNSMNYLEKMKTSVDEEKNELMVDMEYENLEPGCLLIKRDPLTNKIIHKYKKGNYTDEKYLEKDLSEELSNDLINNNRIINTLVELYDKRTEEYIELWGHDDWEKMFRFPNHDYEYFDKLDELLEEELLEQEMSIEEENN
jgi:hypothetical protein